MAYEASTGVVYGGPAAIRLNIYDWPGGNLQPQPADAPTAAVNGCAYNRAGTLFAAATLDGVWVYDTSDWSRITVSDLATYTSAQDVAFSDNGQWMAVVSSDGSNRLRVFNTSDWSEVTLPDSYTQSIFCARFTEDSSLLAVAGLISTTTFYVLNTSDWSQTTGWAAPGWSRSYSCDINISSNVLALGSDRSPGLIVYDLTTKNVLWQIPTPTSTPAETKPLSISKDGTMLAFIATEPIPNTLGNIYNPRTAAIIQELGGDSGWGRAARFSPDGEWLAVGLQVGARAYYYDTATWTQGSLTLESGTAGNTPDAIDWNGDVISVEPPTKAGNAIFHGMEF